jgi:hypothetical protein
MRSNENKMSDGGRERASIGVEVWKASQEWSAQRSAVRSIAWLGVFVASMCGLNIGDIEDSAFIQAVAPETLEPPCIRNAFAKVRLRLVMEGAYDTNGAVLNALGLHDS